MSSSTASVLEATEVSRRMGLSIAALCRIKKDRAGLARAVPERKRTLSRPIRPIRGWHMPSCECPDFEKQGRAVQARLRRPHFARNSPRRQRGNDPDHRTRTRPSGPPIGTHTYNEKEEFGVACTISAVASPSQPEAETGPPSPARRHRVRRRVQGLHDHQRPAISRTDLDGASTRGTWRRPRATTPSSPTWKTPR